MVKVVAGAAALLITLAIAGCGNIGLTSPSTSAGVPGPDPGLLSTPPALTEAGRALTCGSPLTFSAEALLEDPGVETADHPLAEALGALVKTGEVFPERLGWRLVLLSEESALFLLPSAPEEGPPSWWSAEFQFSGSGWEFVRGGQCDVRPWFDGIEAARWEVAPGGQPGPESRTLQVVVFEQSCASGKSPDGRVVLASVDYLEDSVIVTLGVTPLSAPQTCQGAPPGEFVVELAEPLGDRALLDGWIVPPEPRWP